jgi:bifunctional UDP-N-acetylglucosamine pyrophosphorylase/glucosamine-1-phosphate N-acetyltransferase
MTTEVIVLAAGRGTRMASSRPKMLHMLGGMSLLDRVLATALALNPERVHAVIGPESEYVKATRHEPQLHWHVQVERGGTAHAVELAMGHVAPGASVVVLYSDVPLVRVDTLKVLRALIQDDRLAVLSAHTAEPYGLGRIVRSADGTVTAIVEEADATVEEKTIAEVNTGIIAAPADRLHEWLPRIGSDNQQRERYLTDVVALAFSDGVAIEVHQVQQADEALGINTKAQLAAAERALQRREADRLMHEGLTLRDPERFDLRGEIAFGEDCSIDINVVLEGRIEFGSGVTIGPNCHIRNTQLADDVTVHANCVIDSAQVGQGASIGPFARLRPEAELGADAQIGNFVEIKKSQIKAGTKINHLAYIGDSEVGQSVNIGAGVITCNYDGHSKYKTVIGDGAFIGSNAQLVAPVTIGPGATIGAGSTIRQDAPAGKLTLTHGRQKTLDRWRRRQDD